MLWKHFDSRILDNSKCIEEAVICTRRYHVQIWITAFELHSEGHMEEMQSERHASFYVVIVEDLNVESSYFLIVYIGILFVEFRGSFYYRISLTLEVLALREKSFH